MCKRVDRPFCVLVMEKDHDERYVMAEYLRSDGMMNVISVGDPRQIKSKLARENVDLVVLGFSSWKNEDLALVLDIRSAFRLPLVVVTGAQLDENERAAILEVGADDCLTRPVGLRELLARVRAVLRRRGRAGAERPNRASSRESTRRRCQFGGWQLDRHNRRLTSPDGADVRLTKSEYALLIAFTDAPRAILSRHDLIQATRVHEDVSDHSIDIQILRLRRKLHLGGGKHPCIIETVRGAGYMFMLCVENVE